MKYGIISVICFLFFFFICMGEIQFWFIYLIAAIIGLTVGTIYALSKKGKADSEKRLKEAQEKWKRTPSKYK